MSLGLFSLAEMRAQRPALPARWVDRALKSGHPPDLPIGSAKAVTDLQKSRIQIVPVS